MGVGQLALQDGVTGVPVLGKHSVTVAVRTSRAQISSSAVARRERMATAKMVARERALVLIVSIISWFIASLWVG